jgi:hypothetical protein
MNWKKHTPQQIVAKLTDIRREMQEGATLADAIGAAGVSEATYFRWRAQYGGMDTRQVESMKSLALQNARLRRALQSLELGAEA